MSTRCNIICRTGHRAPYGTRMWPETQTQREWRSLERKMGSGQKTPSPHLMLRARLCAQHACLEVRDGVRSGHLRCIGGASDPGSSPGRTYRPGRRSITPLPFISAIRPSSRLRGSGVKAATLNQINYNGWGGGAAGTEPLTHPTLASTGDPHIPACPARHLHHLVLGQEGLAGSRGRRERQVAGKRQAERERTGG